MTSKRPTIDTTRRAREFIDGIVAINKRYGMTERVHEDAYDRAIEDAAKVFEGLRSAGATHMPPGETR